MGKSQIMGHFVGAILAERKFRWIWIHKISYSFNVFTLLNHNIASANNVVVTVLYLLQALHRRVIVYRLLSKIQRMRASLATAIYGNKMLACLLPRSQRLIEP